MLKSLTDNLRNRMITFIFVTEQLPYYEKRCISGDSRPR